MGKCVLQDQQSLARAEVHAGHGPDPPLLHHQVELEQSRPLQAGDAGQDLAGDLQERPRQALLRGELLLRELGHGEALRVAEQVEQTELDVEHVGVVGVEDLAVGLDELLTAGRTEPLLLLLGDGLRHLGIGHLVIAWRGLRVALRTQPLTLTV